MSSIYIYVYVYIYIFFSFLFSIHRQAYTSLSLFSIFLSRCLSWEHDDLFFLLRHSIFSLLRHVYLFIITSCLFFRYCVVGFFPIVFLWSCFSLDCDFLCVSSSFSSVIVSPTIFSVIVSSSFFFLPLLILLIFINKIPIEQHHHQLLFSRYSKYILFVRFISLAD